MPLAKTYNPAEAEPRLQAGWQAEGVYHFDPHADAPVYAIDTPPPTVSGHLHLGHVYSYSHPDFVARFWRMRGARVYYPMGYDDNGLPTERLVERRLGVRAADIGRQAFIEKCLEVSEEAEQDYQALWQRLGLSIDWRYTYRTIDTLSRRTSQLSFLDLYRQGRAYRRQAPTIWCPECRTAIAQAELSDLDRDSEFVTLDFRLDDRRSLRSLPIATTRPELLPACVAVFVHPDDPRYQALPGRQATVPLFGQTVPLLADLAADPNKGTGAVMCCTFGDTADVVWWQTHNLPLVAAIGPDGRMTEQAGILAGLPLAQARRDVVAALEAQGLVLGRQAVRQSVRVHERCDTPVEYLVTPQWFVRVLDIKDELAQVGEQVAWFPAHMGTRYREWVEGLSWDWLISRQRYFGVTFPLWYCATCGEPVLADDDQLPVDPAVDRPRRSCACGSAEFIPETDVMDTWATSSMTPQIVGQWQANADLYAQVFPFTLRPQAHEIIRTWAFYTIVKSFLHFGRLPWRDVLISGWGIAGEGMGKISKSRGGGPMAPQAMIEAYSADAVRYWTASTGPGKDAVISEDKIKTGQKLINKLWNVARFAERFVETTDDGALPLPMGEGWGEGGLSPADRWLLAAVQRLVGRVTTLFEGYDYAAAKSEIEGFFWQSLADNYIEMAKQRLYDDDHPQHDGARQTLSTVWLTTLKLFAPFFPHITEEIYLGLFAASDGHGSIHRAPWPEVDPALVNTDAEALGERLVEIATAVRRYKSERALSVGAELARLRLTTDDARLAAALAEAQADLSSVTRAREIVIGGAAEPGEETVIEGAVGVGVVKTRS